ncbi:MAG TPA: aminopeptidase P family protein, partial [Rhizobiales bacterium]|nr:aminopeptidase P family protein [Hyphomicrobiales bacterium]
PMFQTFKTASDPHASAARLKALRKVLKTRNLDGFIIPMSDEFMNEYVPPSAQRLKWISGFSGSAGTALVLQDEAVLFVDGRYTLQAARQTDPDCFRIEHLVTCPPAKWLEENLAKTARLGFDPWLHSGKAAERLQKACNSAGAQLVACTSNPVDEIWHDRPAPPCGKITAHPLEFAGETAQSKLSRIRDKLAGTKSDALVLTLTDSIAWAFNIRGHDIPRNPVPLAFAIIPAQDKARLYVDPDKLTPSTYKILAPLAAIKPMEALIEDLEDYGKARATLQIDPASCAQAIIQRLEESGAGIKQAADPCIAMKAIKNAAEQNGARAAHIRDGAALARFLYWLEMNAPQGQLSEISAVQQLEKFRRETGRLKDISFDTISGSGPNGAIVHYRVDETSNRKLRQGELYLVDSGGQYEDGTTDVTRTLAIGSPPAAAIRHYTLVLKGHIALARARFPAGTTGAQLDVLARNALWQAGLDYDHGTGHGVGSYLSVHEGPQSISKRSHVALEPGMILSNEPGYYKTGEYGIRIENLMLVREAADIPGGEIK